jgi:phage terminase small subunit
MTTSPLPSNLHRAALDLIEAAEQEYVFDHHERALLHQAAIALSVSLEAAEIVAVEGMFIKTARGGGLKQHPAVGIQRSASITFSTLLKALGLTVDGRRNVAVPGARNRLGGRVQ